MGSSETFVDSIEATLCVDQITRRDWIEHLARSLEPMLGGKLGMIGMLYDATDPARMRPTEIISTGEPRYVEITREIITRRLDQRYVENTYRVLPCAFASETPDIENTGFELFRELGVNDLLGVNGVDPTGQGCFVGAPLGRRHRLSRKARQALCRVSTHMAAGHRLLRRGRAAGEEAVLDPSGRVEHAEGPAKLRDARERLARAVRDMEQARGQLRHRDPYRASELWSAMVAARWTLVDHFESDGKRYVVARVNEAFERRVESLSARERQVADFTALGHASKLIAYELGLSDSTVRVLLMRVYAKLGVRGRAEFLRAWREKGMNVD
jgi:DNA-binding CsgD family transcriptional regulator